MADTFTVPNLPCSQAQRNEIFSETSSRVHCELCEDLQQNNILQQVIQEAHSDPYMRAISEQQDSIGQIIQEAYRLREETAQSKRVFWRVHNPLQDLKSEKKGTRKHGTFV